VGFFLWELVLANALVAWEVITPTNRTSPAVVRVPLRCASNTEIALFANLISLTPGTLSLECSVDRSALYVHGLHVRSAESFRARLARLEDRLLEVTRWEPPARAVEMGDEGSDGA
jgi:multicomponent Na+:H+ antiporter subunit E